MTAFYNEIEPYAADWLENLIAAGHIAPGIVDRRDIRDIRPDELAGYTQCHFFAGIGVWSHALRNAGWPDDRPVWTGSCPCQPFSAAGRRGGVADERHLWPHWYHLIAECRPAVVFGEQVASKDGLGWLDLVSADLEGAGYAIGAEDRSAAGYGAPHIRQRLFFGAHDLRSAVPGVGGAERQQWLRRGAGQEISEPGEVLGSERRSDAGGPADTDGLRQQGVRRSRRTETGTRVAKRGDVGGVADAQRGATERHGRQVAAAPGRVQGAARKQRLRSHARDAGHGFVARPTDGFWRDADWLFCRDGKWRPVEPGTFPLAHGAATRVGRLRAYGNAIVAPVAQAFIEDFADAVLENAF